MSEVYTKFTFFPIIIIEITLETIKKILPRPGFEPTPAQGEQQFGNSYVKM